jgi:hypothetical protein
MYKIGISLICFHIWLQMHLTRAQHHSALPSRIWRLVWRTLLFLSQSSGSIVLFIMFLRGPSSKLSHQSRQNVIIVHSLKKTGYKGTIGKEVWVFLLTFCVRSSTLVKSLARLMVGCWQHGSSRVRLSVSRWCPFLGQVVLSLCGGSGSLMEAAMHLGRSCIMFEVNGTFSSLLRYHLFRKAVRRRQSPDGSNLPPPYKNLRGFATVHSITLQFHLY